ncbi:hypothetical protein [Streptomyces sp. NPDC053427]|uniref:hypothetical protein n=1 Tax=Streptomyces sp. NPDC053427 TaxID=3365701 RepID=UPI0037D26B21
MSKALDIMRKGEPPHMRLKFIAPAVASAALLGTALTSGVATASTPGTAHTAAVATAAAPASCVRAEAQESVKIRTEKKVGATALGLFPKGKTACIVGGLASEGGSYNLCGHKDNTWLKISYAGNRGWIPYFCGSREL